MQKAKPSILFLTKYPRSGASSRYRVYQYLPFIRAAGIHYRVSSFMSEQTFSLSKREGWLVLKLLCGTYDLFRRLTYSYRFLSYDVIYMQREALPFGPLWLERLFRCFGKVVIFDYDDALFIYKKNENNRLASLLKSPSRIPKIMQLSHSVFAGNDWLKQQALSYCADARTFYVAEDLQRYYAKKNYYQSRVVLGWLGSSSTEKYLYIIEPVLRELCERYPHVELHIVGGGKFSAAGIRTKHIPWDYDTEVEALQAFDIGLMPLPLEAWSKGKSGGKARTYMSVGLPGVVTDIGFNQELVQHGRTGFLVESLSDWKRCLERLIIEPEYREQIGKAARLAVEKRFDLEVLGPEFCAEIFDIYNKVKHYE